MQKSTFENIRDHAEAVIKIIDAMPSSGLIPDQIAEEALNLFIHLHPTTPLKNFNLKE